MGRADFFANGKWNFICDLCGAKRKSSDGVKTWDNHYVCKYHKEVRNPQDFLRGVKDDPSIPWSRSEAPYSFTVFCTLQTRNAIPGYGGPGCLTPGLVNTSFLT